MKKQMANSLILSLILIFACGMQAYSQEEIEKAKAPFRPSEPPRLYIAPTADIIPSLDLSIAGMYLLFQKRRLDRSGISVESQREKEYSGYHKTFTYCSITKIA